MLPNFLMIFLLFNWFTELFHDPRMFNKPIHKTIMYPKIQSHIAKEKKEHNLLCVGIGGGITDDKIRKINIHYDSKKNLSLCEIRKLFVKTVEDLIEIVQKDPKIQEHLLKAPFTYEGAGVTIGFPSMVSETPLEPTIEFVFVAKKNICYSIRHPSGKRLEVFHREPYEDALKIVREEETKHCLEKNNAS